MMARPLKLKRCKVCKNEYQPYNSMQKVCNPICAQKYVVMEQEKRKLQEWRKEKKAFYLSDTRHQHKLTQAVFNKMRVLEELAWFDERGLKPYCISCGKSNMDWCCGHFKTVGSSGALRYDRQNTFLQCNKYCNMSKSGNIEGCKNTHGYKKGLAIRFGEEQAKEIIDHCERHQGDVKKWSGETLEQMRKEFSKQIRELQRERESK